MHLSIKLTARSGRRLAAGVALACSAVLLPVAASAASAAPSTPGHPVTGVLSLASSGSAAVTHPQSKQLATAALGSFMVVLTKVRDTETGKTGQAEVLARGYVNGKLLATRRIGDGYGWNWFASGVCSLTITTGTGPSPVHVVRQITVVMLYDPGIGCVSTITKSWPAQLTPASQPAPARPVTAYIVNVNGGFPSVTPVDTATSTALKPITGVGRPIAITPNGRTAYVVNGSSDTVTPITTATNTVGKAIKVGNEPEVIVVTRNDHAAGAVQQRPAPAAPAAAFPHRRSRSQPARFQRARLLPRA
jgi:YVTN family beta-propeller protein